MATKKSQTLNKIKRERLAPPSIDNPDGWLVRDDKLYRKIISEVVMERDNYFVKTARVVRTCGENRGAGTVIKVLKNKYPERVT